MAHEPKHHKGWAKGFSSMSYVHLQPLLAFYRESPNKDQIAKTVCYGDQAWRVCMQFVCVCVRMFFSVATLSEPTQKWIKMAGRDCIFSTCNAKM